MLGSKVTQPLVCLAIIHRLANQLRYQGFSKDTVGKPAMMIVGASHVFESTSALADAH